MLHGTRSTNQLSEAKKLTALLLGFCAAACAFAYFGVFTSPVVAEERSPRAIRTLETINIEGEIAVPQVLFITSRDYRRFRDGTRLKFYKNSLHVARSVDRPARLRVIAQNKEEGK